MPDPVARLHFYITEAVRSVGSDGAGGIPPRFVTAEHWRLHQLFPDEMSHATQAFTDLVLRQLEAAAAEGLLAPADPERDAWFVTKLVMGVYHHYAFAAERARCGRHRRSTLGVLPRCARRNERRSATTDHAGDHHMSREQATSVEVPDSLDVLLTPEWLTGALSLRFPGIEVTAVTRGPVVERVSTNVRFHIECDSLPSGLSPDLCVKGYFSEQGRAMGAGRRAGGDASTATLPTPPVCARCGSVWADVHPQTRHGVVITEDVIAAGGEFFDALTPYSVDQVASTLGELARLHAFAWESSARVDTSWLTPAHRGHDADARPARDPRQLRRTERCARPIRRCATRNSSSTRSACWRRVSRARAGP